jgi:hypothetical protein
MDPPISFLDKHDQPHARFFAPRRQFEIRPHVRLINWPASETVLDRRLVQ